MWDHFILGTIQGITEWLPISSEGAILLANKLWLHSALSFDEAIREALFLHLGTFLAALIYFSKDVLCLSKACFQFSKESKDHQNMVRFLVISTLISGALGIFLLKVVSTFTEQFEHNGRVITVLIGFLLLITAFLELKAKRGGYRREENITLGDCFLLGIVQGFAALPGLSRSGLTVSTLLFRKYHEATALRLSFLMSLPIVLGGNILLNYKELHASPESLVGLAASFFFGIATIHILLKVAQKINFGYFVIGFGILTLISAFI